MARPKLSAAFGVVVRQHRANRNLSQERLAEIADLHRNYVGMLERGECVATLDVAERIAQALGIKLEDLIGEARRRLEAGTLVLPRRRRRRR
jgi:transcriptional regulator with XRE-family HTH domain